LLLRAAEARPQPLGETRVSHPKAHLFPIPSFSDAASPGKSPHSAASARSERITLEYAAAITQGHEVDKELFARVSGLFGEEEIIELTAIIAFELCAATFNHALGIEANGVCPLPKRLSL